MNETSQIIAQMRRDYISLPLSEQSVDRDPIAQFKKWFHDALEAQQSDPEAMILATVTRNNKASARVVLLRNFDQDGFVFFTNYDGRKGQELIANPNAALTFYWHALNRQVRIEGTAEKIGPEDSDAYFQSRPRDSRIAAWASPQSEEIVDRASLEARVKEIERRFGDGPIPCPPFWGGFRVRPETIEFWQGRESRLHDRILYSLTGGGWQISRLAP